MMSCFGRIQDIMRGVFGMPFLLVSQRVAEYYPRRARRVAEQ